MGWLPLDTTPGYYYDAVSLQQMISAPDQVNKNAALEDPSFEANQATDTTGSRRNGDARKRVAVRMGAVILGGVTLLVILALLLLGVLEIGRIWDYESMHRKYERVDQKEKIHMRSEEMEKLLGFLGISMSLGWKTNEVDEKIHEKYPGVEAGSYLRVCRIMENPSTDRWNWKPMRCVPSTALWKSCRRSEKKHSTERAESCSVMAMLHG